MAEEIVDQTYDVHEGDHHMDVVEHGVHIVHSSKKEIWRVFFILLAITILEFLIALTPVFRAHMSKEIIVAIFFILTVFKAFYIVGYFMHLRHEKLNMAYTILVPLLFIAYLIALLMFEGGAQ